MGYRYFSIPILLPHLCDEFSFFPFPLSFHLATGMCGWLDSSSKEPSMSGSRNNVNHNAMTQGRIQHLPWVIVTKTCSGHPDIGLRNKVKSLGESEPSVSRPTGISFIHTHPAPGSEALLIRGRQEERWSTLGLFKGGFRLFCDRTASHVFQINLG